MDRIVKDIRNIGCIYPSFGNALYDEPMQRLAHRVAATAIEVLSGKERRS